MIQANNTTISPINSAQAVSTICIGVPIPLKEMECTMHPPTLVKTSFY
jgi:hypothetical protein